MHYRVVILSEDPVFARMLELEIAGMRVSVTSASRMEETDSADVLILDLDSVAAPASEHYRKMIGFSRRPAVVSQQARSCSLILRRPFRMSLLRREVLAQLELEGEGERVILPASPEKRSIRLLEDEQLLECDGRRIPLTPNEQAVLRLLLRHRGSPVSGKALAAEIGCAEGNEAVVYVCYLRRKTDELPGGRLIRTVRGKGYQIL